MTKRSGNGEGRGEKGEGETQAELLPHRGRRAPHTAPRRRLLSPVEVQDAPVPPLPNGS